MDAFLKPHIPRPSALLLLLSRNLHVVTVPPLGIDGESHGRGWREGALGTEAVGAGVGVVGEVGDVGVRGEAGEDDGQGAAQLGQTGADDAAVGFDDGPDCGGDGAPWGGCYWVVVERMGRGRRGWTHMLGLGPWLIGRGWWCGRLS